MIDEEAILEEEKKFLEEREKAMIKVIRVLEELEDILPVEPLIDWIECDIVSSSSLIGPLTDDEFISGQYAEEVVQQLGGIEDERAIETLLYILKFESYYLRLLAAESLVKFKNKELIDPIVESFKDVYRLDFYQDMIWTDEFGPDIVAEFYNVIKTLSPKKADLVVQEMVLYVKSVANNRHIAFDFIMNLMEGGLLNYLMNS
ncbi:MAG: HEAT repeat domain-containing protein [Candidatus Heimdallarchaeaceae archaeon]